MRILAVGVGVVWMVTGGGAAAQQGEPAASATGPSVFVPGGGGAHITAVHSRATGRTRLIRNSADFVLELCFQPGSDFWGPVTVRIGKLVVGNLLVGAGPVFEGTHSQVTLRETRVEDKVTHATWTVETGQGRVEVESSLHLRDRTLEVEYVVRGPGATELTLGRFTDLADPEMVESQDDAVQAVRDSGFRTFFAGVRLDPASEDEQVVAARISSVETWDMGGIRLRDTTRTEHRLRAGITFALEPGTW